MNNIGLIVWIVLLITDLYKFESKWLNGKNDNIDILIILLDVFFIWYNLKWNKSKI